MIRGFVLSLILFFFTFQASWGSTADRLGLPPGIAGQAGVVQAPFLWSESKVSIAAGSAGALISAGEYINFMPKGAGEVFRAGPVVFEWAGEYRVFVYAGAGWASGTGPHDRFVVEIDGQPAALFSAKGTGGASNLEWSELNRVRIDKPGAHELVWRHIATGSPRTVQHIVHGLVFVPVDDVKSADKGSQAMTISKDGWIRSWLVGGVFGMGGLSSIAPYCEQYFEPMSGMTWDQYWLDTLLHVTWREYVSPEDKVSFDEAGTFADRPGFEWPVGRPGSAYAHLYITIPSQRDVLLEFVSSGKAEIFLNGELIRTDKGISANESVEGLERRKDDSPLRTVVTMQGGPNRLMVKVFFPQKKFHPREAQPGDRTWFKCRFLDLDGSPITGTVRGTQYAQANVEGVIGLSIDPPDLLISKEVGSNAVGRRLGDLLTYTLTSSRVQNVFLTGQEVRLGGSVGLLNPFQRLERFGFLDSSFDRQPQTCTVYWQAVDFDGKIVARDQVQTQWTLQQPGRFSMVLGKLPRGHYTVYGQCRRGTKLIAPLRPKMVVVTDPPTLCSPGVDSKFAHSFYYLLSGPARDDDQFFPLLALAKVRLNIGSVHDWWIAMHPRDWVALPAEKRTWDRAPQIERIERARRMGIELVGQVGGFYPGRIIDWLKSDPTKHDHLVINRCWDCGPIDGAEADAIIDTYVYETVKKFKSVFRYWRMGNELNNREFTPAELAHLHAVVYKAMKRADPNAMLWGGSISSFDIPYVDQMLQVGYDKVIDIHDYHYYIWPDSDMMYKSMGGLPELLATFRKYGTKVPPIANGEFGCYRSIHSDGARTQAAMYAWALTAVHTYKELHWISTHFLTPLEWTVNSEDGICPGFLAYRTAADMLEGADYLGPMHLGKGIAAYRFKRISGKKVIVLWDVQNREAKIAGTDKTWSGFDVLGRKLDIDPTQPIRLSQFPIYLTNGKLDEGVTLTPGL